MLGTSFKSSLSSTHRLSLQFQNHVVADNPAAAANPSSSDAVPQSLLPLDASSGSNSSSSSAAAAAAKPANIKNHVANSIDFSNEELELTDVCRAALAGSSPGTRKNQLGIWYCFMQLISGQYGQQSALLDMIIGHQSTSDTLFAASTFVGGSSVQTAI